MKKFRLDMEAIETCEFLRIRAARSFGLDSGIEGVLRETS